MKWKEGVVIAWYEAHCCTLSGVCAPPSGRVLAGIPVVVRQVLVKTGDCQLALEGPGRAIAVDGAEDPVLDVAVPDELGQVPGA